MKTVSGVIRTDGGEALPYTGSAIVRVVNVTYADAPSQTVSEARYPLTGGEALPFELTVTDVDDRAMYAVQVHLDVNASGHIKAGDYVTMRSYPVLTRGFPSSEVTVKVCTVR